MSRPSVLLVLTTTVMTAGAMFTVYTYIAPILLRLTGARESFVPLALALIGIGFTIGNFAGGRLADWSLKGTLRIFLTVLGIIMFSLPLMLQTKAGASIGLVLWGAATFAVMPSLQVLVMLAASQAPSLASAVNIGAFNIGNAIGAAVGGGVIGLGLGYGMVPIAGGLLALGGVAIAILGGVGSEKSLGANSDSLYKL